MAARGEVKNAEALGRMLQQGRLVSGLTQRDLANRVDTDQKYIWALESGKNTIILERIFAIMRETGVRMYMEVDGSVREPVMKRQVKPMADLRVELYGELVGHLVGTDRQTFDFVATKNAIDTFGLGSTILSESVPFDLVASRRRASRRRNFFRRTPP
jgi:transcriptional regulator with XRE-family HTH domain